jgi:hypothetical protein
MAQHIVIRREEYVAGTQTRPEVGVFTQTHSARHHVPWGRMTPGERVWKKWSGGPIVAHATVEGFRQIDQCTPDKLRDSTKGFRLYDPNTYWAALPPFFHWMTIYLSHEQ